MAEDFLIDTEYGRIAGDIERKGSERAVAILTHGLGSDHRSRTIRALRAILSEAGISTMAIDLYGHGSSEGDVGHLTITKAVAGVIGSIDHAISSDYESISLMGSSFSGAVCLIAAMERDLSALVLKCPVFDLKLLWDERLSREERSLWKKEGSIDLRGWRWSYDAYEDAGGYDMEDIASEVRSPTLIIHGDQDDQVPLNQSKRLESCMITERRLEIVEGADHRFGTQEHFERMVQESSAWIASHTSLRKKAQCCPRCMRFVEAKDFMNPATLALLDSVMPYINCPCGYHGLPISVSLPDRKK